MHDDNRLLTIADLSRELGVPEATIYAWRHRGKGPDARKIGRHLRWRRQDVDQWIDDQRTPDHASIR